MLNINKMNKKIRVLHAIRQGKIGGGESHVIELVQGLDPLIFESIVLSFTYGPMVDFMKSLGVKTYVIETETPFDFTKWTQVKLLIKEEKIDIVHAHGTRANSNVFSSARKLKIPLIYTVHGWSFHPDQNFIVNALRVLSERYLVNRSSLTLCVSDNNLKDAQKKFDLKRSKVVKLGVNTDKFNPDQLYPDLRSALGIEPAVILVGYIVRMTKQKDPFTLIRAIEILPSNCNLKFIFVGDGDLKEKIINFSKKIGVFNRIIFLDFREDVPNVLNAIDIYCLPSLWEGLPLGMLEAMAMKKVIIATAIDGTKEVIVDKSNGLLIPIKSPEILAETLLLAANNIELRKSMGENALLTIKNDFNIDKMVANIQNEYKQLL